MQRQADFQRTTSRRRFHRSCPQYRRPFAGPFLCEELEDRRLLCGLSHEFLIEPPQWSDSFERQFVASGETEPGGGGGPEAVGIVWTNRGQTSDNFNATFGNSANAARAVVDAAIDDWERVITNWNRDDGTQTLQINISISGVGFGAAGTPAASAPTDGKPTTGSITIGSGNNSSDPNDANGWYLDLRPNDWSEFDGTIINAFAGRSSVNLGPDLYSIASAEITHVLGLISDKNNNGGAWSGYRLESSGLATNTNIIDNAEGGGTFGRFWTFDGPTVDHLMTSYNSGDATNASWGNIVHSAGGGGNINFNNVNWRGSEDVGNANNGFNERTMPSWVMAHVLADAYAYSISDPESFGSMYAGINTSNGVLTIRGGEGNSSDVITLGSFTFQGTQYITVSVDVGDDVPGTRHLAGTGNLPEWLSSFPAGSVSSIVINGEAGQDFIRIEDNAGKPVTVNAGDGDDFIDFSFGGRNLSNITGVTTVNGGTGTDSVFLYDNNNAQNDGYLINTLGVIRNGFAGFTIGTGIEATTLITGTGNNQVDIPLARAGMNVFLNSAGGQDVVNIGSRLPDLRES